MNDFLKYWDTRIDAHERFFNNYPHIANFAFSECQALWDYMEEERNVLLTSYNALVEAVAWERECEEFDKWSDHMCIPWAWEWDEIIYAARAEVDRLIANESEK